MKKALFLSFFLSVLISCEKVGDLKQSEIIPGGCALENKGSATKGLTDDINKVTYSFIDGNLDIFVGFNASCCSEYSTFSQIKSDSILINVKTTQLGSCNCICYYTYDFKFTGTGDNYMYKVTLDETMTFTGKIKH